MTVNLANLVTTIPAKTIALMFITAINTGNILIPNKFDETFKFRGVDINCLFQDSNLMPLSSQFKHYQESIRGNKANKRECQYNKRVKIVTQTYNF